MKILRTKWANLTLVFAMLISLLPPLTAFAAGTISVTNLYAPLPTDTFNDASVNKFTINGITVDFLINGITVDQISGIYYEVLNQTTNQNEVNTTNKPKKSISNNNQVSFQNVQLTPGLNKITVKFGSGGGVASSPAYAYYTPVANISQLQFNGVDFIDGGMYPKAPPYTGAAITGKASNGTELDAAYQANVFQPAAFTNGDFTFVTNTGRSTDLNFNPGDNAITFTSRNLTNLFTAPRSFVFDNGKAFAYNAYVDLIGAVSGGGVPVYANKLVGSPNLIATGGTKDIQIKTDIKNPLTSGGLDQYVSAEIYTTGVSATKLHVDFATVSSIVYATGGNLNNGAVPKATISKTSATSSAIMYSLTGELPINTNTSLQEINFVFKDANGQTSTSKYTFSYVDPNLPYIDHVDLIRSAGGGTTTASTLSESGTTQISEVPAKLNLYTDLNASYVQILLNGVPYKDSNSITNFPTTSVDATHNKATVDLQGIPDGPVTMQVVPLNGSSTPNQAGIKQYNVVISGAPYVIVNNLYNGMVVDSADKLKCSATSPAGPCFTGRFVNLPVADYSNLVFTLNGIALAFSTDGTKPNNIDPTTGSFTFTGITNPAGGAQLFQRDGKYTLKIEIRVGGQLVTTSTTDIFILSDKVPAANLLKPIETDPLNPQYIAGSLPDTYITRAGTVQLQGQVINSSVNATPGTSLYLRKAATTPVTSGTTVPIASVVSLPTDPASSQNFKMTTAFTMPEYGDYIFELVSANGTSGSTASKIITITREPVSYLFISPQPNQIIQNSKGVDQVSINQNYYLIKVQADKADSVIFGKEPALFDKTNNYFVYEAKDLKIGANEIKFTVNRGTAKTNGSIILFNTNTGIEGAQYKTPIASTLKIFDGDIQIKFPKDTSMMRNDRTNNTQYISKDRKILFGIANNSDGRVDKVNESLAGTNILREPTGHFKPASKRFWVDGGIIQATASSTVPGLQDAYLGSGILPNTMDPSQLPFYTRNYKDLVVPTKPGTITLKYDSYIRDDSAKYLTVYQFGYFDNPSGFGPALPGWKNIGGVVDAKSNTITAPVDSFGYFQVMYMELSFNDVTNHPWARNDLDTLYSKGIMLPKTPGQFLPNDTITRGEFVTMLVKIFDIPLINQDTSEGVTSTSGTFLDVQRGTGSPNGLYDFLHIEAAARAGIVRGNANGTFLPNSAITRQDAAVMIARAADLKLTSDDQKALVSVQKLFTDANNIDFYALPSVEAVTKAGLIEGKENVLLQGQKKTTLRFDPLENFTRAEASAVAVRVLKQQKKLPK